MNNPYLVLNISKTCSMKEIKVAYRKLAKKHHPDISNSEESKIEFIKIKESYDFLIKNHEKNKNNINKKDLDLNIDIPFLLAINGGEYTVSFLGKQVSLLLPSGIRNGSKLRFSKLGAEFGYEYDDLYLFAYLKDDEKYYISNNKLYSKININMYTAIFGGTILIKTPSNEINIKIPSNIKNGQKIRLPYEGFPITTNNELKGDLFLDINIELPNSNEISFISKMCLKKI